MRQRTRLVGVVSLAAVLGLLATACGSSNNSSSSGTGAATTAAGAATTAGSSGGTEAGGSGTCKAGTGQVPPIATGTADGKGKKVGLLFDVTGRGDKSFNDAGPRASQAKADYAITGTESTPTTPDGSDRPPRIKAMAGNQDLIVAVGFLWGMPWPSPPRRTRSSCTRSSTRS